MRNKGGPRAARRAVVLLSGGLDSATTLYAAKALGFKAFCLTFEYGQRHAREINAAKKIAARAACPVKLLKISLPWKGSSLLDKRLPLPKRRKIFKGIPSTYVPGRNTIFLSFALSFAEAVGATDIFIGANALDFSGYPDCRPRYFRAFSKCARLATRAGSGEKRIRIRTPLIALKKSQIIKLGMKLGVPFKSTWSCYKGAKKPCGSCDSCILRAKGFREAGVTDPILKS